MSALDDIREKREYTDLESVIVTYSFYERQARGDEKNPAADKAADELAALQERVRELEKKLQRACDALETEGGNDELVDELKGSK